MPVLLDALLSDPDVNLRFHIYDNPENLIHDSDLMKLVMIRSEFGLNNMLAQRQSVEAISGTEGLGLYNLATRLGWAKGCDTLWSHRVPLSETPTAYHKKLLCVAHHSNDMDTLQFWLNLRSRLSAEELYHVGTLEDTLKHLQWCDCDQVTTLQNILAWPASFEAILQTVVQQRKALQRLAELHLEPNEHCLKSDRLLDVHAFRILDMLAEKKVDVHPSLRPGSASIWYKVDWRSTHEDICNHLYDTGFRDLTSADFEGANVIAFTPLLYYASHPQVNLGMVNWFVSKGASLYEEWPNTNTTALHCLAAAKGKHWSFAYDYAQGSHRDRLMSENLSEHFLDQCSDDCTCGCSPSGCSFFSIFGRAFLERHRKYSWQEKGSLLGSRIDQALASSSTGWLMAAFIRLAVFARLEIRHTCCDLSRIRHDHGKDPDPLTSPVPHYPAKETARILKEDAYLLELLETLVEELFSQYNEMTLGTEDFFEQCLTPRMDEVMQELAEQDDKEFGARRRDMGVIMEYWTESESEQEGEDDAEISGDEEQTSEREFDSEEDG
jgi:hypothetical protein